MRSSSNIFALFLLFSIPATSCGTNHYILSKSDLSCIETPPVTIRFDQQEKTFPFSNFVLTTKDGRILRYYPNSVTGGDTRSFSFRDEEIAGGKITEINGKGIRYGLLAGAMVFALISFPMAVYAEGLHDTLDEYEREKYHEDGSHYKAASVATFFGSLLGALVGSHFATYRGKARVVPCHTPEKNESP